MFEALFNENTYDVLGINRRNQEYVRPLNPLSAKSLADNKLKTKRILRKEGINVPETYKVIRTKTQLKFLDWESLPKSFVIKPNRGSMGSGILVFYGKKKGELAWIRPNGKVMTVRDIEIHMGNILEGRFSMGNRRDIVIIEERIQNHPELKKYSYRGVPDIRLIVFNGVPVMSMVRLPTLRSDGKANLHAGGICAGIDIASGLTTYAMHLKKKPLVEDTYEEVEMTFDMRENLPLRGLKVPFWDEILKIGVKCQQASGLGYLGVDIVIDKEHGPLVLELNARPGLGIQIANNAGLRSRLERVKGLEVKDMKHGIRVAKNLFGGEIEESIESLSGKKVVNLVEKLTIYHKEQEINPKKRVRGKKIRFEKTNALMDTGVMTSRIDKQLASRLGFTKSLNEFFFELPSEFKSFDEAQKFVDVNERALTQHEDIVRLAKVVEEGKICVRPVIIIRIKVSSERKEMEAVVSSQNDTIYPIIVGRKELKDYLIDVSKTFTK